MPKIWRNNFKWREERGWLLYLTNVISSTLKKERPVFHRSVSLFLQLVVTSNKKGAIVVWSFFNILFELTYFTLWNGRLKHSWKRLELVLITALIILCMLLVSLLFRLFVKIKAKRKEMSCKLGNDLCLHCNYVTTYNLALGVVIFPFSFLRYWFVA